MCCTSLSKVEALSDRKKYARNTSLFAKIIAFTFPARKYIIWKEVTNWILAYINPRIWVRIQIYTKKIYTCLFACQLIVLVFWNIHSYSRPFRISFTSPFNVSVSFPSILWQLNCPIDMTNYHIFLQCCVRKSFNMTEL